MASERDNVEQTEAPSPRLITRARDRGFWPRSRELMAACCLLAAVLGLRLAGSALAGGLARFTEAQLVLEPPVDSDAAMAASGESIRRLVPVVLLVLAIPAAAACVTGVAQVGLRFRPAALLPDLSHLSPAQGLARVFSARRALGSLAGTARWAAFVAAAAWCLWQAVGKFNEVGEPGRPQFASRLAECVLDLATKLAFVLVALSLADYAAGWWWWHRELRMTRAEAAVEQREAEGDPTLRRRRRQRQLDRAAGRSDRQLSPGDCLVVGKGRIAVAVRPFARDRATIIAKAIGPSADRLRQAARRHDAPVVSDDTLAQTLYRRTKAGDPLAAELALQLSQQKLRRAS